MPVHRILFLISLILSTVSIFADNSAMDSLAKRVTENTSLNRIEFRIVEDEKNSGLDWFEISALHDSLVLIKGNNVGSLSVGLNHYLKYVAGIHISWNNLTQKLPDILPVPSEPIYRETALKKRYYLNYCTFSYSMAFWDEERWMKELDWMALHGINVALSVVGIESVWKNLLLKYGYSAEEILEFIPGPSYTAWWLMGNLEGWGGPVPLDCYNTREELQKKIVSRMHELEISPVFPGYWGMVPHNFEEKSGIGTFDTGLWCGFQRPAFISPRDSVFNEMADMYYKELTALYGPAEYYSMDPFHEGLVSADIDLTETGRSILNAMQDAVPGSKWLIQSWHDNPKKELIDSIDTGDLLILDLYSEKVPKWLNGYNGHDWIYCMLLNFGGNTGLHGRVNALVAGFQEAESSGAGLKGIGATAEGIENNPLMFELLYELPWTNESFDARTWLGNYLWARYGAEPDGNIIGAWTCLFNTVLNAPVEYRGEGTVESVICARPSWNPDRVSTWGDSELFYSPDSTAKALKLMKASYGCYAEKSKNFLYDYVDVARQANADRANSLIHRLNQLKEEDKQDSLTVLSNEFLTLILQHDSLLSVLPDTRLENWICSAEKLAGENTELSRLFKKNAAMLITVWGDSVASNSGGLHDYSHREWGGLIKGLYYKRWKAFFDHELRGAPVPDFYEMEKEWIESMVNGNMGCFD